MFMFSLLRDLHSYILQHGRLDERYARFILGEAVAALLSVHALGLAYNDLKPENVLITELGHIKLADFGACRAVSAEGAALLSRGNELLSNLRGRHWGELNLTMVWKCKVRLFVTFTSLLTLQMATGGKISP